VAYLINVLVSLDQLLNVLIGGYPDETISSRVGRNAAAGKKWALIAEKVINALFWFDPNHCRDAVELEELDGR
jgi:hypothetical protein